MVVDRTGTYGDVHCADVPAFENAGTVSEASTSAGRVTILAIDN